jgi:hypothetical protein
VNNLFELLGAMYFSVNGFGVLRVMGKVLPGFMKREFFPAKIFFAQKNFPFSKYKKKLAGKNS